MAPELTIADIEQLRPTRWEDLKIGDAVLIGWYEYVAEGQPPVYWTGGPHTVQSVQNRELTNGASQFRWDGDLYRALP